MSNSIYSVIDWVADTNYVKDDIVKYNSKFYYCLTPNSDSSFTASNWGGLITNRGIEKPQFIWTPSYTAKSNHEPKTKSVQFGNGYKQRARDGINNLLLNLNLSFETRKLSETTAILHFLEARAGVESFVFIPPPPYTPKSTDTAKRFICEIWDDTENFFNNYTIQARFQEVPV